MYPLQWMGAVRMRVQTADKHITIMRTAPFHQLTSGVKAACLHETKPLLKYKSSINNIVLSSEKVIWSEICTDQAQFTREPALNKYVCGFWCERQQEEELLWIMGSYFDLKRIHKHIDILIWVWNDFIMLEERDMEWYERHERSTTRKSLGLWWIKKSRETAIKHIRYIL